MKKGRLDLPFEAHPKALVYLLYMPSSFLYAFLPGDGSNIHWIIGLYVLGCSDNRF